MPQKRSSPKVGFSAMTYMFRATTGGELCTRISAVAPEKHDDPVEIPLNITLDVTIRDPLNSTSAFIRWNEPPTCGHCTDCGYFITLDGGATVEGGTGSSSSPTHVLSGLKPFTMYSIQAKAECPDGNRTPFSIPFNFTTERAGEQ